MLISIIIPTFNSEKTIRDNLVSIKQQSYLNYEIIIIDNNSIDKTLDIITEHNFTNIKIIKEKDRGIYDAINKGIKNSRGNIISVLHSDDYYFNNQVLSVIAGKFLDNSELNIVYGDLIYVSKDNTNLVLRYWKAGLFKDNSFLKGWHPPHPSFFAKKKLFLSHGFYNIEIGSCADVELMYRFLQKSRIKFSYINKIFITMRYGGKSNNNFMNIIRQNIEILKFLQIQNNFFKVSIFLLYKILDRLKQFVIRKK
jgi:glycosyltransferase involved in cell wall biosynthesis